MNNIRAHDGRTPRLVSALREVLPRAVTLNVSSINGSVATVAVGSRDLKVRWVGRGGLPQIRDVLQFQERPDVIVGSEISLAARELASQAGVGWVDETGAAEIVVGNIIIALSGNRQAKTYEPSWSPTVLGVAEALLCGVPATVTAVAKVSGHSTSSIAEALAVLSKWELLQTKASRGPRSGRQVVDPDRLLDEYADAVALQRPKAELRCGVLWRDPLVTVRELGEQFDNAGIAWAATGALGAAMLAPYLTEISGGDLYVDGRRELDLRNAARFAHVEPMDGGRLILRPFPTQFSRRTAGERDGIRVAPWPRIYADLRHVGVRGEEAAEHLKEVQRGTR